MSSPTMNALPYFAVCEATGKYKARRKLTGQQIINAAKALLESRVRRGVEITGSKDVIDYLALYFEPCKSEVFVCLYLDTKNRLIEIEDAFRGTINSASVYPREILRRCIETNAAAVVFAHNHPSGSPEPSGVDIEITHRLWAALQHIDVRVLDHVVIGGGSAKSMADMGIIE